MIILNAHVGNAGMTKAAARTLYDECPLRIHLSTYSGADETVGRVYATSPPYKGYFHTCGIETLYTLYLYLDKVRMGEMVYQYPGPPKRFGYTSILWTNLVDVVVLGDAAQTTEEKGREIIDGVVETICGILGGEGNKSYETRRRCQRLVWALHS